MVVINSSKNCLKPQMHYVFIVRDVLRKYPVTDRKNKKMAYVTIRDFFRKLDPVLLVGDDRINEPSLVHYLSTSFDVQEQIIRDQFFSC